MQASKPLNRKLAIILALATMWLFACIGVFIFIHSESMSFVGLHGYDAVTIGQVGGFYLAWIGVQFPAASFAGMIIDSSDFSHPLRTTFWTMAGYHFFFSAIRAVHWPWIAFHNLDQSIPILACLLSTLVLIGVSVFFAWFKPRFHKVCQRYFAH
jgi:hypothetical protein